MVDSRFFGSPTKIFEYMAMGGGIVASDLEQIGEVLSPALRVADLRARRLSGRRRARGAVHARRRRRVRRRAWSASRAVRMCAPRSAATRARRSPITTRGGGTSSGCGRSLTRPAARQMRAGDRDRRRLQGPSQHQWNNNPVGSETRPQRAAANARVVPGGRAHRYGVYAPWMPEVMEFARPRRRGSARDRRRHGHRPRAVCEERRARDRRRSVGRAPRSSRRRTSGCAG